MSRGERWLLAAGFALTTLVVPCAAQVGGATERSTKSPTSYQLIDRALAARSITEEIAYKYRVFAAFGDSRLPEAYRGDDGELDASPTSMLDAYRRMKTFSAGTQAEIKPFFMRPASPGSWLTLSTVKQSEAGAPPGDDGSDVDDGTAEGPTAPGWSGETTGEPGWYIKTAVGGKVQVWAQLRYPDDVAKADAIAAAMTTKIWPDLVGLFWEPLGDGNLDDNGGNPALDMYLVRPDFSERNAGRNVKKYGRTSWRGIAMFADPVNQCGESPHYLLLDSRMPLGGERSAGLLQDVAHEFAHAVTGRQKLLNFDCDEYIWIKEATGTWAEHFVYPNAQSEQKKAREFMDDPRTPLDSVRQKDENDLHHYGAYLFPLYLMFHGRLQAIPKMWEQFGTKKSLAGIDAALAATGKNLEKTFPEFAVDNWNRATANTYDRIDQLKTVARVGPDSFNVSLQGTKPYEKLISLGMHHLATEYVLFRFDKTVKTVTFDNTVKGHPFAGVWGIEKIKGQWKQPDDWTESDGKTWCRDVGSEDIEELVIVFTNKQWANKQLRVETASNNRPVVKAYPTGCANWTASIVVTTTVDMPEKGSTLKEVVRSSMRFIIDTTYNLPGEPRHRWKVVSGTLSWESRVTGRCSGSMQGSRAIQDRGGGAEEAVIDISEKDGKMVAQVGEGPWPGNTPTFTVTCPNDPPSMLMLLHPGVGVSPDLVEKQLAPDGKSFAGDYLWDLGGLKKRFQYTFRVAP